MGLVAAKCTQCGANIEVDDTKEAGICKYCGTAFITEKAITNYNTYITNNYTTNNNFAGANVSISSVNVAGLLADAKRELLIQNWKNANVYLDEIKKTGNDSIQLISDLFKEVGVLEIAKDSWKQDSNSKQTKEVLNELSTYDTQNIDFWLFMMKISNWADNIISYGNKVITLAPDCNKLYYQNRVYTLYIEKEFDPHRAVSTKHLVDEIPISVIRDDNSLNILLYNKCKDFIVKNQSIIGAYIDIINRFSEKLQDDEKNAIQDMLYPKRRKHDNSSSRSSNSNEGCYIATCIYGSYDCPQVWTLRRFRDYTLDETWCGRLFIKCYYAISPTLVKWFGEKTWFRSFWRTMLDKMVAGLNSKGIEDTQYSNKC